MPLLVMCGQAGSGKSYRANQLKKYLINNYNIEVIILNEESFNIIKKESYDNGFKEKQIRAFLKSNVEKHINQNTLVILDSMNYIKGYRYELFCMARTNKTTYSVFFIDSDIKTCKKNNNKNENNFTENQIDNFFKILERPIEKNRWDFPLFTVFPDEKTPFLEIYKNLFINKVISKAPVSTKLEFNAGNNFITETEKTLQNIIKMILNKQNDNIIMNRNYKYKILFNNNESIEVKKEIKLGEIKNWKKEFINMNRLNPLMSIETLQKGFIYFIKTKLN